MNQKWNKYCKMKLLILRAAYFINLCALSLRLKYIFVYFVIQKMLWMNFKCLANTNNWMLCFALLRSVSKKVNIFFCSSRCNCFNAFSPFISIWSFWRNVFLEKFRFNEKTIYMKMMIVKDSVDMNIHIDFMCVCMFMFAFLSFSVFFTLF